MRATEAGSRRASGHRIENAPLSEYQMFRFDPRYTVARWRDEHFIASKLSSIKPVESSVFQLGGDDLSGKVNLNVRALADLALYPDLSSVQSDKLLGQG
jgi:hypothetical protein